MEPPSYMWSVIDWSVVMLCITVLLSGKVKVANPVLLARIFVEILPGP